MVGLEGIGPRHFHFANGDTFNQEGIADDIGIALLALGSLGHTTNMAATRPRRNACQRGLISS